MADVWSCLACARGHSTSSAPSPWLQQRRTRGSSHVNMPKQWCRCGFVLAFLPVLSVLWGAHRSAAASIPLSQACSTSGSIRTCTLGSSADGWQMDAALGRGTSTVVQSIDSNLSPSLSAGNSVVNVSQDASFTVRGVQLTDVVFPSSFTSDPWQPIVAMFSLSPGASVLLENTQLLLTNCSSLQSYMAVLCSQAGGPSINVEMMAPNTVRINWLSQPGLVLHNVTMRCDSTVPGSDSVLARLPCTSANISAAVDFMTQLKFAAQAGVPGWVGVKAAQLDLHNVDTTKPLAVTTPITIRGFAGQSLPEVDLPPGPLIQPIGRGSVGLEHLALVNLPFGPPEQMAASALTMNVWSVKFPRLLGALQGTQLQRLSITNCLLHIPADEMDWLVHWFADLPNYDVDSDFSNNAPVWLSEWLNEANTTLILRNGSFTHWGVQQQLYLNEWQGRYGWWSIINSTLASAQNVTAIRRINSTGILTWIPTRPPVYLPIPNLDKLSDQVMRRDLAVQPGTSPVYAPGQQAYQYALLNDVSMSRESFLDAADETVIECNISCIGVPQGHQTMDMRGFAGAARIASNASIALYNVQLMNLGTFWGERPSTSTLGASWDTDPPHPLVNYTLPMWFFTADSTSFAEREMQVWLRGTRLLVPSQEWSVLKDFATQGNTTQDVYQPAGELLRRELYGQQVIVNGSSLVFPIFSFLHLRGRNVTISPQEDAAKAGLPFPAMPYMFTILLNNPGPGIPGTSQRRTAFGDGTSDTSSGLSPGARLGVVLGVILGVMAVVVTGTVVLLVRYRKQKHLAYAAHRDLEAHLSHKDESAEVSSSNKDSNSPAEKCGSPRSHWPSSPLATAAAQSEAGMGPNGTSDASHHQPASIHSSVNEVGRQSTSTVGALEGHDVAVTRVMSHNEDEKRDAMSYSSSRTKARSHPDSQSSAASLPPRVKTEGHAGAKTPPQSDGTSIVKQRSRPQEEMARALQAFGYEMSGGAVELHALIGKGAYGAVYAGTWKGLQVAIKRLLVQHVSTGGKGDSAQLSAIQEAALNASLNHPNIITTYTTELHELRSALSSKNSTGSGSGAPIQKLEEWHLYIIQEYCDGGSLADALGQHRFLGPSPTPTQREAALDNILLLAINIAAGMAYLHSKLVVHGDLKPDNILLKNTPTVPHGCVAKVCDFGLSVKMEVTQTHVSGVRHGTPLYIAPEVLKHSKVSASSDAYSFGVILWELWHGELAWDFLVQVAPQMTGLLLGGVHMLSLSQLLPFKDPEIHPGYVALCQACLHPDPSQRPSFEAAVELLCAFMVGRMHRHPTLVAACQGHAAAMAKNTHDQGHAAALHGEAQLPTPAHSNTGFTAQQPAHVSENSLSSPAVNHTLQPPSHGQAQVPPYWQLQQQQEQEQQQVLNQAWNSSNGAGSSQHSWQEALSHSTPLHQGTGTPATLNTIIPTGAEFGNNSTSYAAATAAAAAGVQMIELQQGLQGVPDNGVQAGVISQGSCPHNPAGGVCRGCRRASSQHVTQVVTSFAWGTPEDDDASRLSMATL